MPLPYLEKESTGIKKRLLRSTLITGSCLVAGIGLLIPAFSVKGTKFDSLLFCFKPKIVFAPQMHKYCQGKKIRRGIAWMVAQEHGNHLEFKSKVKLLKKVPAQNPYAALYGLASAIFLGGAYLFFKDGTSQLEGKFADIVRHKLIELTEGDLAQAKHIGVKAHASAIEEDYLKQQISRAYEVQNYLEIDEDEKTYNAEEYAKAQQLRDADINRQLATLKAEAAEKQEKEAKHLKEIEKLSKASSVKDTAKASGASEEAIQQLEERLKEHEEGWLYTLCTSNKLLFITGSQGSWKSYCSATIALCRHYLRQHKIVSLTDPHLNKNLDASWKEIILLEPACYGSFQNWAEINEGLATAFDRWATRLPTASPVTSIFDELTNYSAHEECRDSAEKFMRAIISDPRKSNEGVIVVTHSMSNKGTGGGEGFASARAEGAITLKLNSDNEQRPLFKGTLEGFKDEEGELIEAMKITIPYKWFNPASVKAMFEAKP